jgi:hypothetical protein
MMQMKNLMWLTIYMNSSRRLLVRPCHGIVLKKIPSQLLSSFFTLVKMTFLVEIWSQVARFRSTN